MSAHQRSIGRANAIWLAKSGWWLGQPPRELAKFQLMTRELCMPFDVFRQALETALGRPVWIHELGFNLEAIIQELFGERDAPTLDEILDLLPAGSRWVSTEPSI